MPDPLKQREEELFHSNVEGHWEQLEEPSPEETPSAEDPQEGGAE